MLARLLAPVWNSTERRLRAPWRLLLFAVALGLAVAGVGLVFSRPPSPLARLVARVPPSFVDSPLVRQAVGATAAAVVLSALVAVAAVVLDRRPLRDYGLAVDRDWWLDLAFGFALGAALMGLVFAVEYALGWVVVRGTLRAAAPLSFPAAFLAAVVLFLAVGMAEELLLRGYVLTNVAEGLRALGRTVAIVLAILFSSALFGVLHAGNPNATALSTAAIALGGVMFALGYVLTGDLAIPVGLHVSWNLFQGPVFGYPVSGLDIGVAVLVTARRGPTVATGGPFGPEAGLTGIGAMVLGILAVVAYVRRRRGHIAFAPVTVPRLRWWWWTRPADVGVAADADDHRDR